MIYTNPTEFVLPNIDILTLLFDSEDSRSKEDTPLHAEAKYPDKVITKRQSREITKHFAHFFRNQYGIGKDGPGKDIVVAISTGQSALASLFYGVIAADGIFSAASPSSTASELARQLRDGPSTVLVCSPPLRDIALAAARLVGMPEGKVLVLESYPDVKLQSVDGTVACDFKGSLEWRRITDAKELEASKICILYSSGTTGLPKGVLISHQNLVAETFLPVSENRPTYDRWEKEGRPLEYRTLGHLPAAHIAGLQGYLVHPMYSGGIVFWMPSFNFDDFVRYCGELKVTYIFSVPPIHIGLAKDPRVKDQFQYIRQAFTGAAPLTDDLQAAASKKFGKGRLNQTWGLSETTGSATHTVAEGDYTLGSVGTLLPNVQLRLVDEEGKDVAKGEAGEAWLKGPIITQGYHNNPEANANAFTEDGWFRTGDVLQMRKSELFVVDRKKELIKYKGNQVAPAELEGILASHAAVMDAAVIGVPYNNTEVPIAYVALVPPATGKITEKQLVEMVNSQVASYKQLRGGVRFVDVVPRSPSGKILRKEVRKMYNDENKTSKL